MDLDWITLYDYMSIFSRSEITSKINKFYESFYPLKLKKTGRKSYEIKIKKIERGGLFGIIASYISKVLFALEIYYETQYLLTEGDFKQEIKLSKMFVEIQSQNLQASLNLQKLVYVITEAYKYYNGKQGQNQFQKDFLEIKLLCSLNRMLQFYYHIEKMKKKLEFEGYEKIYNIILNYSVEVYQKAKPHLKLFPQIRQILQCILVFFESEEKQPFNFHAHLMEQNSTSLKKTFTLQVKKLFSLIPNKQKNLFLNLGDENFFDFLVKSGCQIQKQPIENYSRSEEQINSLIAQEENFVESILVPEKYRGKPEWKKKVVAQLMNLSIETKKTQKSKLLESQKFKLSNDFPINLQ